MPCQDRALYSTRRYVSNRDCIANFGNYHRTAPLTISVPFAQYQRTMHMLSHRGSVLGTASRARARWGTWSGKAMMPALLHSTSSFGKASLTSAAACLTLA
eukprot:650781-Rhodomonas_salina.1